MTGFGQGDVGDQIGDEVAGVIGVAVVGVVFICADHEVAAAGNGGVGDAANVGDADGGGGAGNQAGGGDLLVLGETELVAVEGVLQLDLVDVEVTADGDEDDLAIGGVEHRLEGLRLVDAEELAQGGDGLHAGGADFLEGQRFGNGLVGIDTGGFFGVGGVAAGRAGDDCVLAGVGGEQEFVGVLAADGAAVGLGHDDGDAATAEDVAVGLGHGLVGCVKARVAGVEGVGVLHGELPDTDEPGAGSWLVAKLGLHLVEDNGQIAVALHVSLDDVGDDLLVGGRQRQGTATAVLQGEHVVAESGGAAGLLPQLHGLEGGHAQFLAAGGVHLLADDLLDLAEGAPGQGEVGVNAGGDLLDEAGAQHQAMAGGFGLGRVVAEGAGDEAGDTHYGEVPSVDQGLVTIIPHPSKVGGSLIASRGGSSNSTSASGANRALMASAIFRAAWGSSSASSRKRRASSSGDLP